MICEHGKMCEIIGTLKPKYLSIHKQYYTLIRAREQKLRIKGGGGGLKIDK